MLDEFWGYYQSAFATDAITANRYRAEDAYTNAQQIMGYQQLQQQSDAFDEQLRAIDGLQGTTFMGDSLAGLNQQILAAELAGWNSAFN